jgi:electron transfer flavoprotein beta subunit
MLNIIVCVKAVPDPRLADKLRIDPSTKSLLRMDIPLVINPLDRHALEAALQLRRKYRTHITVISMGPSPAGSIVRECVALGADKGILLNDPAFAGADAYATAYTIVKAIENIGRVDAIFCGMASSDGATEWVGPEVAALLKLPIVTFVREIVKDQGDEWIVKADIENGFRLVKVKLPAVFTVTRDLNKPKQLNFSGIIKSRNKEITEWDHISLGVSEEQVGLKGSPTYLTKMTPLEYKRNAQMIEGTLNEKADRLVQILSLSGVV